jgi:two-component system chemotaxis response regulator CheB
MQHTVTPPTEDRPVASICPECGGLLTEDRDAPVLQWTCRVGHRYSATSLADAQGHELERKIWAVIRSLEDRRRLLERIADKQPGPRDEAAARLLRQRAREAASHAEILHRLRERMTATTLQPVPGRTWPQRSVEAARSRSINASQRRSNSAP